MAKEGIAKGLAYRHDFGSSINNLYRQEQMYAEQRMEKERKAKYYAEFFEKPPLASPGATKQLEVFANEKIKEASNYAIQNPGFENDPEQFAKFRSIADGILNNDIVRKDKQVQQSFAALRSDVRQGLIDEEDAEIEMEKYTKYHEDQSGEEDYYYMRPKRLDMLDIVKEGVSITGSSTKDIPYGDGSLMRATSTKENRDAAAQTILNDKKKRQEIERNYIADKAEENGFTIQQYLSNRIKLAMNIQDIQSVRAGRSSGEGAVTYNDASQFGMNIEEPLLKAMQAGSTGLAIKSSPDNIVFIGKDPSKITQLSSSDGVRFITDNGNGGESYDEIFSGSSIHTKIGESEEIITVSGFPYVKTNVIVQFEKGDDNVNKVRLENIGKFTPIENYTGVFSMGGRLQAKKSDMITMSGAVLMPANFDRKNMLEYDKKFSGEKTMRGLGSKEQEPWYRNTESRIDFEKQRNEAARSVEQDETRKGTLKSGFKGIGEEGWRVAELKDGSKIYMSPDGEFNYDKSEKKESSDFLGPTAFKDF